MPVLRHDERLLPNVDGAGPASSYPTNASRGLPQHYDTVVDRLLAQTPTFIHGEMYASNVLVDGTRVCPIDWEMAALGPALVDVAALIAGPGWNEADAMALLGRVLRGAVRRRRGAARRSRRVPRAYLAVQWLGWSSSWSPPAELAHDWLSVAVAATERLGSP